jgi:dihydroorotate dehydrogenase (fumarate)
MDLSTTYLGLSLKNPLVPSAGPLTGELDSLRRLEDAGAAAVVLPSLFEEQIEHEAALHYFPASGEFRVGPEEYLELVSRARAALEIPVLASLNGVTDGGWVEYARLIENAGADGLELNLYYVAASPELSGRDVEERYLTVLKHVKSAVDIPVAVKLGPFFSSLANMACRLDGAGAAGLVLFNRFYQPDIDLETLEVVPNLLLSTPQEMRLPLRWIAILHGRLHASLAATTGVASAADALKLILVGADAVQLCSVLLRRGPQELATILAGMETWMAEKEYESVAQMKGSMSQKSCPHPAAYERANYMKVLTSV